MAEERKFKFVSPGVFTNEIDKSQFTNPAPNLGPVVVGRAQRGPSMVPVVCKDLNEFTSIFGDPEPGTQQTPDVWRNGSHAAPLYGVYAAKAYLNASQGESPVTFIRLAGVNSDSATDAQTKSKAGWFITQTKAATAAATKGAYGLFACGVNAGETQVTGALAAIFYVNAAAVVPTGSAGLETGDPVVAGVGRLINSATDANSVKLLVTDGTAANDEVIEVSTVESSDKFIRKSYLNKNPQFVSQTRPDGVTSVETDSIAKKYWLGETFERFVADTVPASSFDTMKYVVLSLSSGSNDKADHRSQYRDALSPWFISQELSANTASYGGPSTATKLFRIASLNGQGEWASANVKISIDNIRYSVNENAPYGTFDLLVRAANDTDVKPNVLERFVGLDINPNSPNYIATRIGDEYYYYDSNNQQFRVLGQRPNNSKYIRVIMSDEVENGGVNANSIPFGYYGVPKINDVTFAGNATTISGDTMISWGGYGSGSSVVSASAGTSFLIKFPVMPVRSLATDGGTSVQSAFFGIDTKKSATSAVHNPGWVDYTRFLGADLVSSFGDQYGFDNSAGDGVVFEYGFTLDEVVITTGSGYSFSTPSSRVTQATYTSGSRVAGTAFNCSLTANDNTVSYKNVIKAGVYKFTVPMFGGFDGLNVFEREPFRNNYISAGETRETNYVLETYYRAMDIVKDPELIEFNLASVPGLTNTVLTKKLIDICEERGDSLAIVDTVGGYIPSHEQAADSSAARLGSLSSVYTSVDARNLNSSYGSMYYPWVTIRDDLNGSLVKVPPSVAALGVMANTERVSDVWFAPAGFNRGGLSAGAAGLPVVGVDLRLSSKDRDDLYIRNINPIAQFPAEGIVIFGQKTLQISPLSALTRINVRRLMIYLKKGISRIASTVLFEQNVQATWNDFKSRAENFLGDVKVRFGLDDYKVVLDETTTTPDLVDRNIMYAKVYVKPTRTIEFIALDFIITRAGASFDD
jgi:hypothetical protein